MEYRFVTADDQRAIAEQRARQLEQITLRVPIFDGTDPR